MVSIRRGRSVRREKQKKPAVVTGDFELHYEDVVNRNRVWIIGIFVTGILILAAVVPKIVYHSVAKADKVSVEAESGQVANPEHVTLVKGDVTASDNSYIEFSVTPQGQ